MKEPMKLDLSAPHQKYYDPAGKLVVGVTTILGVLSKEALLDWFPRVEREGIKEHVLGYVDQSSDGEYASVASVYNAFATLPVWEKTGKPKWFGKMESGKAADLGTIAHARIEAWLNGTTLDPAGLDEALYEAAAKPEGRFREWWESEGLTLEASECQIAHPTSGYGGTIDFVARDKAGALVLGDIKTTKANRSWPYDTVIAQVAAYRELWEAARGSISGGDDISRCVVVRVGKEADDPGQQVWISDKKLAAGRALFFAAQDAYKALERLK